MSVTQRGTSWQAVVYHERQRFRRQFPDQKSAKTWEAETTARLLRGQAPEMGETAKRVEGIPHTVGELVDYVFETRWKALPSASVALANARAMAALLGPATPVAKVGPMNIDRARAKLLESGNSKATVNRKVSALSTMLNVAETLGIITRAPTVEKYREAQHRIRRFTPVEEAAVLRFCEVRGLADFRDYVVVSLDTGLRQGEVLALRAHNVIDGRVQVFGTDAKSGKSRTVPLTARARDTLAARSAGKSGPDELFPSFTRWSVKHHWARLSEAMGLDDDKQFVPHIMRHEFCSRLADRGRTAPEIMALAGHSALTVTQRYIHINGSNLDGAIASLEAAHVAPAAPDIATTLRLLAALGVLKDGVDVSSLLAKA